MMKKDKDILQAVANKNIENGVHKANLSVIKMIILGIMAGAFIALGGAGSSVAVHNIDNAGVARLVAGVVFPVGLMMVIMTGSELFTGNSLMIMSVLDKKIKVSKLLKNLIVVFFANLIGALIIDFLIFYSGQFDYSSGGLGAYTIKVAVSKCSMPYVKAFTSGIMCNILVCVAIIMASEAQQVIGKLFSAFFPIMLFVICGFEHCVANMFYVPAGMLASTVPEYVSKAQELYGITPEQCNNLPSFSGVDTFLFVVLGNLVGGMLFVGVFYYIAHKKLSI